MPAEYPFKPPAFVMMTPSGRFETGVKICLSISSYHPESWQPSWSVRSALIALIAFMQTPGNGAVGSLDHTPDVRRQIAAEARENPPKHSNQDRQGVIDRLHQKMADMEEASRHVFLNSSTTTAEEKIIVPTEEVAGGTHPPAGSPQKNDTALHDHSDTSACSIATRGIHNIETVASSDSSTAHTVSAVAATMSSSSSSSSPATTQSAAPSSDSGPAATLHQHTTTTIPSQYHQDNTSWEDKGLTLMAILLAIAMCILLLRRVFVTFRPSYWTMNTDELISIRASGDFEL